MLNFHAVKWGWYATFMQRKVDLDNMKSFFQNLHFYQKKFFVALHQLFSPRQSDTNFSTFVGSYLAMPVDCNNWWLCLHVLIHLPKHPALFALNPTRQWRKVVQFCVYLFELFEISLWKLHGAKMRIIRQSVNSSWHTYVVGTLTPVNWLICVRRHLLQWLVSFWGNL